MLLKTNEVSISSLALPLNCRRPQSLLTAHPYLVPNAVSAWRQTKAVRGIQAKMQGTPKMLLKTNEVNIPLQICHDVVEKTTCHQDIQLLYRK
jgi:hypothetical protein